MPVNYFASKSSAERYALGRPDFHANTIGHILQFLGIEKKLGRALDIACGTGLSTRPLLTIAEEVYGTDISEEMLRMAKKNDTIRYAVANGASQPFADASMDLITIGSGVHWLDINEFLAEVRRLLKTKSTLIIYDNFFNGEMEGNVLFKNWHKERYLEKFPPPARNDRFSWTTENLRKRNFELMGEENFTNRVVFNKAQLVTYFTTQSNVVVYAEQGANSYEEVETWLNRELEPFFQDPDETHAFMYGNWIKYLQVIK